MTSKTIPHHAVAGESVRERLARLVESDALTDAQCAEVAVAADLVLSQGSATHLAALQRIETLMIAGGAGYSEPTFDPTSSSIVETVGEKTVRTESFLVDLQDQRYSHVSPTHLRIGGPRGATVMMTVDHENFFSHAWSLAELDMSWIPMRPPPHRPAPIWTVWGGAPTIRFEFMGVETGTVRAAIALAHSEPPPIPAPGFNRPRPPRY